VYGLRGSTGQAVGGIVGIRRGIPVGPLVVHVLRGGNNDLAGGGIEGLVKVLVGKGVFGLEGIRGLHRLFAPLGIVVAVVVVVSGFLCRRAGNPVLVVVVVVGGGGLFVLEEIVLFQEVELPSETAVCISSIAAKRRDRRGQRGLHAGYCGKEASEKGKAGKPVCCFVMVHLRRVYRIGWMVDSIGLDSIR